MKDKRNIEEKKAEIISNLTRYNGIVTVACRRSKIGRTMYYEYLKDDNQFAFKVNEIQESFIDYAESLLKDLVMAGDRAAIMFYLKAKGTNRGYH